MVLSNKKLKQKLRASLAESIALSEPTSHDKPIEATDGRPQSLKQLLDSSTQKPRLTKREKRRKIQSLKGDAPSGNEGVEGNGERSELEGSGADGGKGEQQQTKQKKKKNKRKRDEETEGTEGAGGEMKKAKKKSKSKKKKKEKQKKKSDGAEEKSDGAKNGDETNTPAENSEINTSAKSNGSGEDIMSQTSAFDARKVYVGGIPYYSTEDDIRSYFESCGTIVEIDCMTFPESGRFRGIAIITFKIDAAAKRALALDGADMGGFFLKIQPYKVTQANRTSHAKTANFAPPVMEGYNRIYMGNLSWDVTEEDVRNFLSGCNISSIRFGMDKETGDFRGYAHVDFSDSSSLKMAIKLDQKVLCGRPVKVTSAIPNKNVKPQPEAVATITEPEDVGVDSSAPAVVVSGKMRKRTCYMCKEKGHGYADCPKNPENASANSNPTYESKQFFHM